MLVSVSDRLEYLTDPHVQSEQLEDAVVLQVSTQAPAQQTDCALDCEQADFLQKGC